MTCITLVMAVTQITSCTQSPEQTVTLARAPKTFYGFSLDSLSVVRAAFKANENLSEVLNRYHVSAAIIQQIGQLPHDLFDVRKIQADKPYALLCSNDSLSQAQSLIYYPNAIDYVILHFSDSVRVEKGQHKIDTVEVEMAGVIKSSLYNSMVDQGASPLLATRLADIFAWQIDFFGLQQGDAYKLVYDEYHVNGKLASLGPIKVAMFNHMGKDIPAYSFDQGKGLDYFDDAGRSLRSAFLKAPLNYSRISSHFSHDRFHPVLKIHRPHHGVDYAAPRGTPVQAVGDGTVIFAKYSGGAGNFIKIRHNSEYTTGYMHLQAYAPGIREGARVKQGDVIGFVGATGVATGPHLDFRFWKNDVAVDPLKVDPVPAEPIKSDLMNGFCQVREAQMERLARIPMPRANEFLATSGNELPAPNAN